MSEITFPDIRRSPSLQRRLLLFSFLRHPTIFFDEVVGTTHHTHQHLVTTTWIYVYILQLLCTTLAEGTRQHKRESIMVTNMNNSHDVSASHLE
jgi:hypothetical protein